jgi:multiple sugar transport system substrate-binding protein
MKTLLGLSLSTAILLSACSGVTPGSGSNTAKDPNEKVTINFWDSNAGPTTTPIYQDLIKRFETANPNIHVEYLGLPSASALQKFNTAVQTGDTPDVAMVYDRWVADFTSKGALAALDPYFDKWDQKDKILPIYIKSTRDYAPDKKLYQMPNALVLSIIWYRTDWLKEKNLSEPKTWDDFFNVAHQLTDPAKRRYGFSLRGGPASITQLEQTLWSYSGLDNYFDQNGKSNINNPKNVEFVQKLAALYKVDTPESNITNGFKEMVGEFNSDTAGMIIHNQSSYGQNEKTLGADKFAGLFLPPSPSTGKRAFVPSLSGFSMFSKTKYPEQSWKFIAFLNNPESQAFWNSTIPTNVDAKVDTPTIKSGMAVMNDPNIIFVNAPTYLPDYGQIQGNLEPDFQAVLTGKTTAQAFMDKWADLYTKSKAKYDERVKQAK